MIPHSTSNEWQKGEQTQDHNDKAGSVLQRRLNRYLNGWKTVSICLLEFASDSAFVAFFRQHTGLTPTRYPQKVLDGMSG